MDSINRMLVTAYEEQDFPERGNVPVLPDIATDYGIHWKNKCSRCA